MAGPDGVIDLRSDTVTRPTPEMRKALAEAVVGDDVLGDDPTVKELEAEFARVVGKEAAMYVPSGTMANLCAVLVHCRPGDEAIMEEGTHTFKYEGGGASRFGGVQIRTFYRSNGVPEVEDLVGALRDARDSHEPRSRLFVVENTHNVAGGRVVAGERIRELSDAAHEHGLSIHMDGARLFNAATALGVEVAELAAPVDSVMCCLSKGLGAPVGSALAGSAPFIEEARRARKALGGGMRQAGILAAAGLLALREGPERLQEDHASAGKLALGLSDIPGLSVDVDAVETNMILVDLDGIDTTQFVHALAERGVLVDVPRPGRLRLVLHRDVSAEDVDRAIPVIEETAAMLRERG